MEQRWNLTAWGVRGSMPAAGREYVEYGGNTSCISVECGEDLVVFDAGSGLQQLGAHLGAHKRIDLFLSHMHIDHLMGLFVFAPLHDAGTELHLYGEARGGISFQQQLKTLIGPPYWPLSLESFKARIILHETEPDRQIVLPGGETVRTMRGNHPNTSLMYRLESLTRSVVYTLDCELTDTLRPELIRFCRDADVLVWDASFTHEDLAKCPGWGHSSWEQGVGLRREARAKQVLMCHYSQNYTDSFLKSQEALAVQSDPSVCFAKEGMAILV